MLGSRRHQTDVLDCQAVRQLHTYGLAVRDASSAQDVVMRHLRKGPCFEAVEWKALTQLEREPPLQHVISNHRQDVPIRRAIVNGDRHLLISVAPKRRSRFVVDGTGCRS